MGGVTERLIGVGDWRPVGYANDDGDVVQAWSCPLPPGFSDRVVNDLDGLAQEVADQAAALGGKLVESGPIIVDGRAAWYRIVRLPEGDLLSAVYVAGLVVPLSKPNTGDDEIGVEFVITVGALGEILTR